MKHALTKAQQQIATLLIIFCLTALSGLEPVLHNHELDHNTHDDCISCGWTHIVLDQGDLLTENFNSFISTPHFQSQNIHITENLTTGFLSRAPPTLL